MGVKSVNNQNLDEETENQDDENEKRETMYVLIFMYFMPGMYEWLWPRTPIFQVRIRSV